MFLKTELLNTEVLVTKGRIKREERLNGFYYYEIRHDQETWTFPETIENKVTFNFWGTVVSKKPFDFGDEDHLNIPKEDREYIQDANLIDDEDMIEVNELEILNSTWNWIDKHFYEIQPNTIIERKWAMPSKNPYDIKPIKELLQQEVKGGLWIDPFANKSKIAHITNDLNTKFDTNHHMDALDFLKMFPDNSVDGVLFEPPYSPRQIKECYESVGLDTQGGKLTRSSFWSNMKNEMQRILKVGGKTICFGWNSNGMGDSRGFHKNKILLIAHGGNHNDTIITVEIKKPEQLSLLNMI